VDETATNQTLTHLTNITGFLREIAAELKAINRREAAKEARRSPKSVIKQPKPNRP
jgi:hypothetical protein